MGAGEALLPFPVSEMLTDVLYEVNAVGRDGRAVSGNFGAQELAELDSGDVLTWPRREADGVHEVLSRDEFESASEEFC